ncbi:hypothetical protein GCM10029964_076840 [Kibdelosporangium lantanae]
MCAGPVQNPPPHTVGAFDEQPASRTAARAATRRLTLALTPDPTVVPGMALPFAFSLGCHVRAHVRDRSPVHDSITRNERDPCESSRRATPVRAKGPFARTGQTSTCEPMITVRSRGRLKYSAASAVM